MSALREAACMRVNAVTAGLQNQHCRWKNMPHQLRMHCRTNRGSIARGCLSLLVWIVALHPRGQAPSTRNLLLRRRLHMVVASQVMRRRLL